MRLLFAVLLILTLASCQKDETRKPCGATEAATVFYSGPVSVDGCDVLIRLESTGVNYHPVNLDSIHKVTGLKLYVDYTLTGDSFACGDFFPNYYKCIHLNCISGR